MSYSSSSKLGSLSLSMLVSLGGCDEWWINRWGKNEYEGILKRKNSDGVR